jgi:hypothetical protein
LNSSKVKTKSDSTVQPNTAPTSKSGNNSVSKDSDKDAFTLGDTDTTIVVVLLGEVVSVLPTPAAQVSSSVVNTQLTTGQRVLSGIECGLDVVGAISSYAAAAFTAETGVGAVGFTMLGTKFVDSAATALNSAWTGQRCDTGFSQVLQLGGVSRDNANLTSRWIDFAGGILSGRSLLGLNVSPQMTYVSRWGSEGLNSGDWVMDGSSSWTNYLLSCKWQPGMGNQYAPFSSGQEYLVPSRSLKWPTGWGIDGWYKGLFGQRIFVPEPPPPPPIPPIGG